MRRFLGEIEAPEGAYVLGILLQVGVDCCFMVFHEGLGAAYCAQVVWHLGGIFTVIGEVIVAEKFVIFDYLHLGCVFFIFVA
jgi:hypothetical protein